MRRWQVVSAHPAVAATAMTPYCRRTSKDDAPRMDPGLGSPDQGPTQQCDNGYQDEGKHRDEISETRDDMYENNLTEGNLLTNGFMHGHTQWMSDDGVEVTGAMAAGGNGQQEGGHHDIDDDEEFVAQDDADQYHDEQNVEDADNNLDDDEEVLLASVVRDPRRRLEESRLRVALDVLQIKAKHGWTDTSVDDILEYLKDLLPVGNTCPDFFLANIKKSGILIPYFSVDKFWTLIVVHPQHSHAIYLDSGRDKKKDYTHIKGVLNDALTGFATKTGTLKVQRKVRGGLALTHTTNFACLRQSSEDNGMDAWSDAFFYGYGLPPNDEIELHLEM
ncbi:hypothetical protein QYE76_042215 [Lolium multiflorum]|uniref:Uncharacterized protein n=1 Tax=Lolium multiflorum TaxID=4521 RepID=A0AAD8TGG5_LOLMU|nr:hypothetical protein QYE76_042215 [Lolium multiflorum]